LASGIKARDKLGRFKPKEIQITPTKEWGYFCGLVIGDGWVQKTKSRNYNILIGSIKRELIEIFCDSAKRLGLNPHKIKPRIRRRRFPNGEIREDLEYRAYVSCKAVYDVLKPCKLDDYHFKIPAFVYKSEQAIAGFLQGFFDAEGGIQPGNPVPTIMATSKHRENLLQIKHLLERLGIASRIGGKDKPALFILGYESKIRFSRKVGFRLSRKAEKLLKSIEKPSTSCAYRYSKEIYKKAFELRKKGLSYQKIEDILGIPHSKHSSSGVVCRWINHKRVPYSVKYDPKCGSKNMWRKPP